MQDNQAAYHCHSLSAVAGPSGNAGFVDASQAYVGIIPGVQDNVGPTNMNTNLNAYDFSVHNQPVSLTESSASWVVPYVPHASTASDVAVYPTNIVSPTRLGLFGQADPIPATTSYTFCGNVSSKVNLSSELLGLQNQTHIGITPDAQPDIVPNGTHKNLNARDLNYLDFLAEPPSTLGVAGEPYSGNLLTGDRICSNQVESFGQSTPIPPSFPFTFAFPNPQPFSIDNIPHTQVQETADPNNLQWGTDTRTVPPVEPAYPLSSSSLGLPINMGDHYHVQSKRIPGTLQGLTADQNVEADLTLQV